MARSMNLSARQIEILKILDRRRRDGLTLHGLSAFRVTKAEVTKLKDLKLVRVVPTMQQDNPLYVITQAGKDAFPLK